MKRRGLVLFIFAIAGFFIFSSGVYAIRINEFESNPEGTDSNNEWIELYSEIEINLNNWILKNSDNNTINISISFINYTIINFSGQWLDNSNEKILLIDNNSNIIDETRLFNDSDNDNRTWQYYNGSWFFLNKTKGYENYFNFTTIQNITNSTNITTTTTTQPQITTTTTNPPTPKLTIEVEEIGEADAGDEINVDVSFNNLENYDYDIKIWVELDEKIVSDTYNENETKWKSSNYYLNKVVSHDDNGDTKTFKLKIDEKISGDAKIIGRIRKTGTSTIIDEDSSDIQINVKTPILTTNSSSKEIIWQNMGINESPQILTNKISTITGESIINLGNGEINKDKTYESKTRNMLKIVPYISGILLVLIIVFIILKA